MNNHLLELLITILDPSDDEIRKLEKAIAKFPVGGQELAEAIEDELIRPPKIALIGKSGVGKSSTINALFNPDPLLEVGPVRPVTPVPYEITIPLDDRRGSITIVDGPGLGATRAITKKILPLYANLLPSCDLILWVIKADDRALEADQDFLEMLLTDELRDRLVIGINQVDKIDPEDWNEEYALPSRDQEFNIREKEKHVKEILTEIGIQPRQVISYSALYGYRLTALLVAALNACPKTRGWVIKHRAKLTPYRPPILNKRRMSRSSK